MKAEDLDWSKGLLPAIIQNAYDGQVLMLGYMNQEALAFTLKSGYITFYSRSKERLWTKGESSENFLLLKEWTYDCDRDSLLFQAEAKGPTCHLQRKSCFPDAPRNFLGELESIIEERYRQMPEGSYTTKLFQSGLKRIAQKVGEEGVEVALASLAESDEDLIGEISDLLYHTLVLLRARGIPFRSISDRLSERHQTNSAKNLTEISSKTSP